MVRKLLFGGIFLCLAVVFVFISRIPVFAGMGDTVSGWLWGGSDDGAGNSTGLGWISTNNLDCDADNNGVVDIASCGVGAPIAKYGVNIPTGNGAVTGYAWSENIGWVDFDPQNHCGVVYSAASCTNPSGGTGGVSRSGNALVGWARVVSIATATIAPSNSGGWSGWVRMNPSGSGVTIDPATGKLGGYAWNGEVLNGSVISGLGWIDFSRASIPTSNPKLFVCPVSRNLLSNTLDSSQVFQTYFFANHSAGDPCLPATPCTSIPGCTTVTSDPKTQWTSDDTAVASFPIALSSQVQSGPSGSTTIHAVYDNSGTPISDDATVSIMVLSLSCGSAAGGDCSGTTPTANLCGTGSSLDSPPGVVRSGGSWRWTCSDVVGNTVSCSKPLCPGYFTEVNP